MKFVDSARSLPHELFFDVDDSEGVTQRQPVHPGEISYVLLRSSFDLPEAMRMVDVGLPPETLPRSEVAHFKEVPPPPDSPPGFRALMFTFPTFVYSGIADRISTFGRAGWSFGGSRLVMRRTTESDQESLVLIPPGVEIPEDLFSR